MSLESAQGQLRVRCRELGEAVTELVTIVHEDRPTGSDVAVVDAFTETVSELQSSAMDAAELVDGVPEPRALPARLSRIDEAVAGCAQTYWRDLRAFGPVSELRIAARRGRLEWRTWQRSVEASQLRCELPLLDAQAAVRSAWAEAAELLGLYLPPPPAMTQTCHDQTRHDPDPATVSAVAGTSPTSPSRPTTRRPQ